MKSSLMIRKSQSKYTYLFDLYCLVALILPINVINKTSFYTVISPSIITYHYKDFYNSFLLLPVLIMSFFFLKDTRAIKFYYVIIAIMIKDFFLYKFKTSYNIIDFDINLYLVLLYSYALTVIVLRNKTNHINFINSYYLVALLTMLLRFILNMSTDGRFGAIGLSVGGTGFLCGLYIVYLLYNHEVNKNIFILLVTSMIFLMLTGQRTNIFCCFCFVLYFTISFFFKRHDAILSNKFISLVLIFEISLVSLAVLFMFSNLSNLSSSNYLTRVFAVLQSDDIHSIRNEYSVLGRLNSIDAGISILKDSVLGISNVFYDLQYRMLENGYPTFPHSSLLSCLLLWSFPITIFCCFWIVNLLFSLYKMKNSLFCVVLYIFIMMIFWNGPFLDYQLLFIILYFLSISKSVCSSDQLSA